MNTLSLNGTWDLLWAEGYGLIPPEAAMAEKTGSLCVLKAQVPAPVHRVLMEHGLIEDPNIGLNSLRCRWVEEMFWIYRREFEAPPEALKSAVELTLDHLELEAEVFLNGSPVGKHENAFRPARFDLTGKLRPGVNLLTVKLSSGLHSSAAKPDMNFGTGHIGKLTRRQWHRHPQCQSGWDWQPRLINIGILGDVRLTWSDAPLLEDPSASAWLDDSLTQGAVQVGATLKSLSDAPRTGIFRATIRETGAHAEEEITLARGETRRPVLTLRVENPHLWRPRGYGERRFYHAEIEWTCGDTLQKEVLRIGFRHVELDQSPHPEQGRYCIVKVNHVPVFCKGGNWIPPDMLYSEVGGERIDRLIDEALRANFNMLRIWGGGSYAGRHLLERCDEEGILVWHDFMFACARYPFFDRDFYAEVVREVTYIVRRLSPHPSLILWCGNNEIDQNDWQCYDDSTPVWPDYGLYHLAIPRILKEEDNSKIYWPSSPWSPDVEPPNSPCSGDQHRWDISLSAVGGVDWRQFRNCADRFPDEGGVLGCSAPATIRQSIPECGRRLFSPDWLHHDNTNAQLDSVFGGEGHAYRTVTMWLGRDPAAMPWEEYAFVSALLQAEGLAEYCCNYHRRKYSSAASVFWMFNDCFPTVNSWSIIDYYLRRKLAYHPVRRANQDIAVVVAEEGASVRIFGVNDRLEEFRGELRYGLFGCRGGLPLDRRLAVKLPPNASTPLAEFDRTLWDEAGSQSCGAFAVLAGEDGRECSRHRLFRERFRELELDPAPEISVSAVGNTVTFRSEVFVWGVCLDLDGENAVPDNCFDLLPGLPYELPWDAAQLGAPAVLKTGNTHAFRRNAGTEEKP